jgi:hypothetical protein
VYSPLLYENVWNFFDVNNSSIHDFIFMVGQLPHQLFSEPHPKRLIETVTEKSNNIITLPEHTFSMQIHSSLIVVITCSDNNTYLFKIKHSMKDKESTTEYTCAKYKYYSNLFSMTPKPHYISPNSHYLLVFQPDNHFRLVNLLTGNYNQLQFSFKNISISNQTMTVLQGLSQVFFYSIQHTIDFLYSFNLYESPIIDLNFNDYFKLVLICTSESKLILYDSVTGNLVNYQDISPLIPEKVLISDSWGFILAFSFLIIRSNKLTFFLCIMLIFNLFEQSLLIIKSKIGNFVHLIVALIMVY